MGNIERTVAQAMADYENEHRYELENGSQSTGVEPYEAGAEDFGEIAAFVAERLQGAVEDRDHYRAAIEAHKAGNGTLREVDDALWAALDTPPSGGSRA